MWQDSKLRSQAKIFGLKNGTKVDLPHAVSRQFFEGDRVEMDVLSEKTWWCPTFESEDEPKSESQTVHIPLWNLDSSSPQKWLCPKRPVSLDSDPKNPRRSSLILKSPRVVDIRAWPFRMPNELRGNFCWGKFHAGRLVGEEANLHPWNIYNLTKHMMFGKGKHNSIEMYWNVIYELEIETRVI